MRRVYLPRENLPRETPVAWEGSGVTIEAARDPWVWLSSAGSSPAHHSGSGKENDKDSSSYRTECGGGCQEHRACNNARALLCSGSVCQ